jgi:hypothetical protein
MGTPKLKNQTYYIEPYSVGTDGSVKFCVRCQRGWFRYDETLGSWLTLEEARTAIEELRKFGEAIP